MKFELMHLPYAKNALEPVISEKTLEFHHGKHHQTYINNLNNLIQGTEYEKMNLRGIILKAEGGIFNNAAQVFNHDFYFRCLSPQKHEISPELKEAIESAFGSIEAFKEQFSESAKTNFGSGWTWLVVDADGKLKIENTANADTPIRKQKFPLLTCDVWEHAYYLDYQNRRPDYISKFWEIINWKFVSDNHAFSQENKKEFNISSDEDSHLAEYIDMLHNKEISPS